MFTRTITKEGVSVIDTLSFTIEFTYNGAAPEFIKIVGSGLDYSWGIDAKIYPLTEEVSIYGETKDEVLLEKIYTFARQFFTSYDDV